MYYKMYIYFFFLLDYFTYICTNIVVQYVVSLLNFKYPIRIENGYNINLTKKLNLYDYVLLNLSKYILLCLYYHNYFIWWNNQIDVLLNIRLMNILSIILYIMIQDVIFYGYHRLMHTDYFFNKFHYVHHQNIIPNSSCSVHSHIINSNLKSFILVLPIFIIPLKCNILYILLFITQIWNIIIHESKFRFNIKYINTPGNHLVHHMYRNLSYNYSFWTKIPDIIFGTNFTN